MEKARTAEPLGRFDIQSDCVENCSRGATLATGRPCRPAISPASNWNVRSVAPSCWRTRFAGTLTAGGRFSGVGKAIADEGQKLLAIGHDHGRIALQEGGDDVAEVSRVGTERHGGPIGGRFDHVLPAPVAEAAADESDVGRSPPCPQFADHVDQQHARAGSELLPLASMPFAGGTPTSSNVRRCQATPEASSIRATASNRSG